jgi:hypothetical protein
MSPTSCKDHDGADDALLHTHQAGPGRAGNKCSVELLPTLDRIYGNSEHPMTEIDVEDLCQRGRAGGGTVQILETWLDQPLFRSNN